jgi:hypothetical protein
VPTTVIPRAAAELQQAFLPEDVQRAEHGVLVHAQHRREVLGQGQAVGRGRLAIGDGPADLRGDLVVHRDRAGAVDVDIQRDLAALAAQAGYADQAHLTRECRGLAGLTPAALARQRAQGRG